MDRNAARSLAVAAAGTLAVALSAATLASSVTSGDGPDGTGAGTDAGAGSGGSGVGGLPGPTGSVGEVVLVRVPFFEELVLVVLAVTLAVIAWYAVRNWRDTLRFVAALAALVAVATVLLSLVSPAEFAGLAFDEADPGLPAGSEAGETETTTPLPPAVVVLLLAGFGLVAGALVATRLRSDAPAVAPEDAGDEPTDAEVIGRAAGRAADRIESADGTADNEIYRAWREMTGRLDVTDPETTTPGEFADVAVEAGIDRADVTELTRLFEDVRYGDREPTAADERRGVELLRRVEADHATDPGAES